MGPNDRAQCIDALLEYHYMKYMYDAAKMHKFFAYGFKGIASLSDDELILELKKYRYGHPAIDNALREVIDNMIVGQENMDIFGEKKYEELDIVTKLVEPINWSLLDVLATLPDELVVDNETILRSVRRELTISKRTVYETLIGSLLNDVKARSIRDKIYTMYELQIDGELVVDLSDSSIEGSVKMVKNKDSLTEKDLEYALRNAGPANYLFEGNMRVNTPSSLDRAREILDIIGTEVALKAKSKRSPAAMIHGLEQTYIDILRHDRWRIRDIDLADRLYDWINAYISTGNTAAMRNFCLLKAATHRGYPLYGIDEEKI